MGDQDSSDRHNYAQEVCGLRHAALRKELDDIEAALAAYTRTEVIDIAREILEGRISNLEEEVKGLQTERTWLLRLVMGAIIMAVMSLILVNGPVIGQ